MYVNSYSNRARSRRDDESTIPEINLLKNQDAGESEALTKAQNSIQIGPWESNQSIQQQLKEQHGQFLDPKDLKKSKKKGAAYSQTSNSQ